MPARRLLPAVCGHQWDMLAAGLLCGIAASVLFNVGIALQAIEARSAPAETESWRAAELGGAGLLAGLLVLLLGTVLVARTDSVSRLAAG